MAPSVLLTSLLTFVLLPAVDGLRRQSSPSSSETGQGLITDEQASLVSVQANSSYTPNTGCQGSVELHYTYDNTNDNCGGQYETEMDNPQQGGSHKKQPPHGGWFMVSDTRRRRHRWYCSNTAEGQHCGGGNCMQVWHHSRRRFPINCGQCTCHEPQATHSTVCLELKYWFQGGSIGTTEKTWSHSVGSRTERYTTQDTVHSASVAASASIEGVIPQIGGIFSVTAETRYAVTSAFHSAYTESSTSEFNTSETLWLDMSLPVYILHAQNHIYFEDGSSSVLSGRTLIQLNQPTTAGCQEVWRSR